MCRGLTTGRYARFNQPFLSYVPNTHKPNILRHYLSCRKTTLIHRLQYFKLNMKINTTRMNCFRYLKLMSPLNAAICTTTYLNLPWSSKYHMTPDKKILFKKQLFDLEVKGQGPTKVITVCDTPPYGHAPTYQISLTYLERNNYLTLRSKVKVP
jgi:hypothetical protein